MNTFDLNTLKTACSTCSLRELCVPAGMTEAELEHLSTLVSRQQRVKRGESLIVTEQRFDGLYALRSGFFKTTVGAENGNDQVVGFHIPGEILGLDGVSTGRHSANATALEDSEVCIMPYAELERLASENPPLQRQLHRVMSREIVRDQHIMMLMGTMRAEQRVAAFLLNISERYNNLGYSPTRFVLRMTRRELGSYLGLKLETVSRIFSRLQEEELLCVKGKNVQLLKIDSLKTLMNTPC